MANKVRFFYPNLVDGSGLAFTASSSTTAFDAEHVAVEHPQVVWKSSSDGAQHLKIDFSGGTTPTWNTCIIHAHNIDTAATTIDLLSHTADVKGSATNRGSFTWSAGPMVLTLGGDVSTDDFFWIDLAHAGSPLGYFTIGRIFLGVYFEPTTNYVPGRSVGRVDMSVTQTAMNGTESSLQRPDKRVRQAQFPAFTEAEMTNWRTMGDTLGTHTPLFVGWDTTNHLSTETIYSRFAQPIGKTEQFNFLDGTSEASTVPTSLIEVL